MEEYKAVERAAEETNGPSNSVIWGPHSAYKAQNGVWEQSTMDPVIIGNDEQYTRTTTYFVVPPWKKKKCIMLNSGLENKNS